MSPLRTLLEDFGLYHIGVLVVSGYFTVRLWWSTSRLARVNLGSLLRRRSLAPVPTESPVADPVATARARGEEAIRSQTTVTRRVLFPLIFSLTAVALAFPSLGDAPATLITALGTVTAVFLGMAARPIVENAFAGLVIAYSRIVNIGDTMRIDDMYGTIEDITATHTVLKMWDWRRYLVPNSEMIRLRSFSYSLYDPYLWVSVNFRVGFDADIEKVRTLATEAMAESSYLADHEEPKMWVMEMDETSVRCLLVGWSDTPADGWMLAADAREKVMTRLREAGVPTHGYSHHISPTPPAVAAA